VCFLVDRVLLVRRDKDDLSVVLFVFTLHAASVIRPQMHLIMIARHDLGMQHEFLGRLRRERQLVLFMLFMFFLGYIEFIEVSPGLRRAPNLVSAHRRLILHPLLDALEACLSVFVPDLLHGQGEFGGVGCWFLLAGQLGFGEQGAEVRVLVEVAFRVVVRGRTELGLRARVDANSAVGGRTLLSLVHLKLVPALLLDTRLVAAL